MIIQSNKVLNELGLHARVASRIVRCAQEFQSKINAKKEGTIYDFKSVLGVMAINARCEDEITIEIDGPDEEQAAQALKHLFDIKFGEN